MKVSKSNIQHALSIQANLGFLYRIVASLQATLALHYEESEQDILS